MICPHGGGLGHLLLDILMAIPFIGVIIAYIKYHYNKTRRDK
jgi:hypothetical protein